MKAYLIQSIAQANQGIQQVSDYQGQIRVHHHHHHVQKVQGAKESSETTSQATDSLTESSNDNDVDSVTNAVNSYLTSLIVIE